MTELYRFRSIEYLLRKYNELENQSIYFASPEELNDPLEGVRNIFWQGDKIVWCNFFKQYINCLFRSIINLKICGNVEEFELIIPVEERQDKFIKEMSQILSTNSNDLLSDIYNRIFEKNKLDNFIIELVNTNHKVRTDEMLIYLRIINSTLFPEIYDALVAHGLEQEYQNPYKKTEPNLLVSNLVDMIQADGDTEELEKFFEVANQMITDSLLASRLTICSKSQNTTEEYQHLSNVEFFLVDIPNYFLKQLVDRLVYPRWYAACFTRECNNSSVWGHYAAGHKGVCLIFEANESTDGTEPTITLNQLSGSNNKGEVRSDVPIQIHDINYAAKAGEIDFFRSIGWLPQSTLEECWYSDEEGNFSECGSHLRNNNVDAWKTDYWKVFLRDISVKTRDWNYEKESRMILYEFSYDLSDKKQRTLTYDFNSLKGIIFGISTSNTDKLNIIQAIEKKCQENNRRNFEFFQAYYDHVTGRIQKRNLHLKLLNEFQDEVS